MSDRGGFQQFGKPALCGFSTRRDVLGRHPSGRGLVVAQNEPGGAVAVDLLRPVVEAGGTSGAVHGGQWEIAGEPERAVDLQRPVDDVVEDLRAEELDQ
jgi:hypothetical protein